MANVNVTCKTTASFDVGLSTSRPRLTRIQSGRATIARKTSGIMAAPRHAKSLANADSIERMLGSLLHVGHEDFFQRRRVFLHDRPATIGHRLLQLLAAAIGQEGPFQTFARAS